MIHMSLIDLAFLLAETDDSPKHVAGLQIFRKPGGAEADYLDRIHEHWLAGQVSPPFDMIPGIRLGRFPHWEADPDFSLPDHIVRHRLAGPGSKRQLTDLVANIHADRLPRSRPPWQCHLIDGLAGKRFAVLFKIHHAYGDGHRIGGWLNRPLDSRVRNLPSRAYWQGDNEPRQPGLTASVSEIGEYMSALPQMGALGFRQLMKWLGIGRNGLVPPFTAPRTSLNVRPGRSRQLALLRFPLERVRRIGLSHGCTINDVLLAICDRALSLYLNHRGALPQCSLVAEMPISLRTTREDQREGNRVTLALVRLCSHEANPLKHLLQIHAACLDAKQEVHGVSAAAVNGYTGVLAGSVLLAEAVGIGSALPPLGNVVISNVPGRSRRLYLGAAPLMEAYPVSTLMPYVALNITAHSYAGTLFVGLVGDRRVLGDLPTLATLMRSGLRELAAATGLV